MRQAFFLLTLLLVFKITHAQYITTTDRDESFGNTANVGLGLGYYPHQDKPEPAINFNYEISILPEVTIAPSAGFSVYKQGAYMDSGKQYTYKNYVLPLGVNVKYYFGRLVDLPPRCDLYVAASGTFIIEYQASNQVLYHSHVRDFKQTIPFYPEVHVGAQYHISSQFAVYIDVSTAVATVGIGCHGPARTPKHTTYVE